MKKRKNLLTRTNLILGLLAILAGVAVYVLWAKRRATQATDPLGGQPTTETSVAADQGIMQQLALVHSLQTQLAAQSVTATPVSTTPVGTASGTVDVSDAPDFESIYEQYKA